MEDAAKTFDKLKTEQPEIRKNPELLREIVQQRVITGRAYQICRSISVGALLS